LRLIRPIGRKVTLAKIIRKRFKVIILVIAAVFVLLQIDIVKSFFVKMNNDNNREFTPSLPSEIENSVRLHEYGEELLVFADKYPKAQAILMNINSYPAEILELALRNPEAVDFVVDYPQNYPPKGNGEDINISADDYIDGEIPLFLQWDKRWGYYNYGNTIIAINGCGPTALAMVAVGLTGDTSLNPKYLADFSIEHGYLTSGGVSSWTLMSEGAAYLGLKVRELPLDGSVIKSALRRGEPIIAIMGEGDFTTKGHFIVLRGITDDGKVLVNDPNSLIKSSKEWSMDVFMSQTRNLWAFSR
jgi:hypothetical protein